ncbi:hypothetical protein INT45_008561 [Circinella minor]|uniref:Uncharacterized protein n=1 Tax=Circinella minor TaxID=1195481 RepID=A0A8H7RW70_9FUNG|nr:hypothetical protein INT45_008561 [Circinella minor]
MKKLNAKHELEQIKISHIVNLDKIHNKKSATKLLEQVETFVAKNNEDRKLKKMLSNILDIHVYESFKLTTKYLKKCSEQDLIIKFWSNIFESCFGYDKDWCIHWGDTLSTQHKKMSGMNLRLDLRDLISKIGDNDDDDDNNNNNNNDNGGNDDDDAEQQEQEQEPLEAVTGEFGSYNAVTTTKLYKDKLKSVFASKVHLNHIIQQMKYLPVNHIQTIQIPIIQILGMSCYIYSVSIVDKKVYCVQDVCNFVYPRTLPELADKGFEKMVSCIYKVKEMIDNIRDCQQNYSESNDNDISRLYSEKKKKNKKYVNPNEFLSELVSVEEEGQE